MKKALNLKLFTTSCDHLQGRSGYVKVIGSNSAKNLLFPFFLFFFLFCFVLFAYLFAGFLVFKYIPK